MKTHSTNYYDTLIEIAEDSGTDKGLVPTVKGDKRSIANMQFEMLVKAPYRHTSDDVFFGIFAERKELIQDEMAAGRALFFSKGQPCFRASPLTKQYGWGVHSDAEGRVAIYSAESEAYAKLLADPAVKKVKAMRSKRAH